MSENVLREAVRAILLLEVKAGLVRQQAAKGDVAPAAQALIQKLSVQLSTAAERRGDPAWQRNTRGLVVPLAQFVANQAAMIHWSSLIGDVPDGQEAPEMSTSDEQFHEKVRRHVEEQLAAIVKRAEMGEPADGSEVEALVTRVMANVKKTHQVSPSPRLRADMVRSAAK